ncbi:hypothetical protein [Serratia fonticola]|uniref:hypothetical protein n=1 Tax=Serratia fonticola TaxID=47917 RepID=UPI003AACDE4A
MGRRQKSLTSQARREETKDVIAVKESSDRFISISFKHFCDVDSVGQSFKTWINDGVISDFFDKLHFVTKNGVTNAMSDGILVNYSRFPDATVCDFDCPENISKEENWGVIKFIGGQKRRVVGFLKDNIFYIVFLDRDHRFWKVKR